MRKLFQYPLKSSHLWCSFCQCDLHRFDWLDKVCTRWLEENIQALKPHLTLKPQFPTTNTAQMNKQDFQTLADIKGKLNDMKLFVKIVMNTGFAKDYSNTHFADTFNIRGLSKSLSRRSVGFNFPSSRLS